jgi:hypothetical protein
MRKTIKGGLALAFGLTVGCGESAPTKSENPAQVDASITQSLDRLRALEVMNVDGLVLNLPAEATACYDLPCPGSGWQKPYEDERARQATRLARLADIAEAEMYDGSLVARDKSEAAAAAQALNALQIVRVPSLVEVRPVNEPQCYNLPCQSDIQAADAATGVNVARAFAIADAAKRDGL